MARDYKSYSSNKKVIHGRDHKPVVIAVVAIVVIVLLIAGFYKISQRKLAKNNVAIVVETKKTKKEKNVKTHADTTTAANSDAPAQPPEIKFEFYNILPNEKVVDTSAAVEKSNAVATPTNAPKTAAPVISAPKPATLKPTVTLPTNQSAVSAPASNGYIVQVVSVRDPNDADGISSKLKTDGFSVQTIKIYASDVLWYRIQVGPYKTMDDALSAQMTLRKNNYHAILLKPKH
ncbi:MAG: hypothetical protein EXR81_00110 [Gammaproteobacteria bacterium]|nr:hypothetical protein [Gammaproteobacteria bacterium]